MGIAAGMGMAVGDRIVRGWVRIRSLRTGGLVRLVGYLGIGQLHLEWEQGMDGVVLPTALQPLREDEEGAQLLVEQGQVLFSRAAELQVPVQSWRAGAVWGVPITWALVDNKLLWPHHATLPGFLKRVRLPPLGSQGTWPPLETTAVQSPQDLSLGAQAMAPAGRRPTTTHVYRFFFRISWLSL